jgi:hypothetical protein
MFDQNLALRAMGIAGGIAAISLLIFGWPWRSPNRSRLILGWTLGLGVGFLVGCYVLDGTIRWPFKGLRVAENAESKDRLLFLLLPAAMLVEGLSALQKLPRLVIWILRLLVAGGVAPIILHNSIYLENLPGSDGPEWNAQQQFQILSILGGSLFLVWLALDLFVRKAPSRVVPLAISIVSVGSAVTIMFSANLSGGQLALPLAGALAGGLLASFLLPISRDGTGLLGVSLVVLFGLLVENRFFAKLTTVHAALLFFSLLLLWMPEIPPLRRLSPRSRGLLRLVLLVIPIAFVIAQGRARFEEESRTSSQPGEPTMEDYGNFKD